MNPSDLYLLPRDDTFRIVGATSIPALARAGMPNGSKLGAAPLRDVLCERALATLLGLAAAARPVAEVAARKGAS